MPQALRIFPFHEYRDSSLSDHADIADELIARAHELPLVGRERGGNQILFPEDR
jgi:hypothetical protein